MQTWEEWRSTDTFKSATEEERRLLREHYFKKAVNLNPQIAPMRDDFYAETEPDVLTPSKIGSALRGVWEATGAPILRTIGKEEELIRDLSQRMGVEIPEEIPLAPHVALPKVIERAVLGTPEEAMASKMAAQRQHPWWYYGGELGGMAIGPGKIASGATKGMKLVPRVAARAGLWGTYGGGREAMEQVERGGITEPGKIATTAALWAAMEPVGELLIGGARIGGRVIKRAIKGKPEKAAKILEEDLNVLGITKNTKAKVLLGTDKKPLIEITNPAGETKQFTDTKFARKYIETLAPPAEGKAGIASGIKGATPKAVVETTEDAIKNELRFMEAEIAGYADVYHRAMVQSIRKGTGKGYEKARQVAFDRIQKRTAGLDTTGFDAAPTAKPYSKQYISEPNEGSFAPDPNPSPADVNLEDLRVGPLGGIFMPAKAFGAKLARKLGDTKVYTSVRSLLDNWPKMMKWEQNYKNQAREIFGPLRNNQEARKTVTYILENDVEQLTKRNPTATEYEIASKVRKLYDELFEIMEVDPEIYLKNYAPHFRKYFQPFQDIDFSAIDPRWRKSIKWINELHRKGDLILYETDALTAFDRYVHGAAKKKFLKEGYDYLRKIAKNLPKAEKDNIMDFTDTMYGWAPVKGITGKIVTYGLKKIGATPEESRQIMNLLHRQLYAGGLGFRLFPIIRNFTQQSLAQPVMGTKYWAYGAEKILSRSARRRVHALNIIPERYHPVGIGEEIETYLKGQGMLTKGMNIYEKALNASLWAYRKSDAINREVVFLGYEKKILDIMKKLTRGGKKPLWSQFYKRANLRFFDKEVINSEFKPLFAEGIIKNDFTKLAEQVGKNLVEDTQWIYAKGGAPAIARNHPLLFQFGTWPMNAVHYMRKLTRLGPRGVAKQMAFWGGMYVMMDKVFGIDVRSWIPIYSLLYRGGPMLSSALQLAKAVSSTLYGSKMAPLAWKEFEQSLWIWMPAGLQAKAVERGVTAEEEEEGVKRILGFRPKETKKKSTGATRGSRGGRSGGRGGR